MLRAKFRRLFTGVLSAWLVAEAALAHAQPRVSIVVEAQSPQVEHAISPDSGTLATLASLDQVKLQVWNIADGQQRWKQSYQLFVASTLPFSTSSSMLCFTSDSSQLLSIVDHPAGLGLFDARTGRRTRAVRLPVAMSRFAILAFSVDGSLIAVRTKLPKPKEFALATLDTQTGRRTAVVPLGNMLPIGATFTPDNQFVLVQGMLGKVDQFEAAGGNNPGGDLGGEVMDQGSKVLIWNLQQGKQVAEYTSDAQTALATGLGVQYAGPSAAAQFSPDSRRIVLFQYRTPAHDQPGKVTLHTMEMLTIDAASGKVSQPHTVGPFVRAAAFTFDGKVLLLAGHDEKSIYLDRFELATRETKRLLDSKFGAQAIQEAPRDVTEEPAFKFDSRGEVLVIVPQSKAELRFHETGRGELLGTVANDDPQRFGGAMWGFLSSSPWIQFTPDGRTLMTRGVDGELNQGVGGNVLPPQVLQGVPPQAAANLKAGMAAATQSAQQNLRITYSFWDVPRRESPADADKPADQESPPADTAARIWKSRDGKFQIEAKYVSHSDKSVILLSKEGRRIEVPLERLGEADIAHVRSLKK